MSANEMEKPLPKNTSTNINHGGQALVSQQKEVNGRMMSNFLIRVRTIKEEFNRAFVMVLVCIANRIYSLRRLSQSSVVAIRPDGTAEKMNEERTVKIGEMDVAGDGLDGKKEIEWIEGEVGNEDRNENVVTEMEGLIIQLEEKKRDWESANSLPGQFALKMMTRIRNEAEAIKRNILEHDQEFTFEEHEMDFMPEITIDPEAKALEILKEIDTLLRIKKDKYSTGVDRLESEKEKEKFYHDYISLVKEIVDKVQELSLHYQPGTSEYLVVETDSSKKIYNLQEETGCLAVVLHRWRGWQVANHSRIPDNMLHIEELFVNLILEKLRMIDSRLNEDKEKRMASSATNPALKWMRDLYCLHDRHWKKEVKLWMATSATYKKARDELMRVFRKIAHHWKSYSQYSSPNVLEPYRVVHVYRDVRSNQSIRRLAPVYIPGTEEDCPLKEEVETMECIVCRDPARVRASDSDGYETDPEQSPNNHAAGILAQEIKKTRNNSNTEPLSPEQLKLLAEECKLTENERDAFNALVDKTDFELSNTPSTSQVDKESGPKLQKEAAPEAAVAEKRRAFKRRH